MSGDRHIIESTAARWLGLADEHLAVGSHTLGLTHPAPDRMVAHHAQRAAECVLKALLVYHDRPVPATHEIAPLLKEASALPGWRADMADAESLTAYAMDGASPGLDRSIDRAEAETALRTADYTRHLVRQALRGQGFDP